MHSRTLAEDKGKLRYITVAMLQWLERLENLYQAFVTTAAVVRHGERAVDVFARAFAADSQLATLFGTAISAGANGSVGSDEVAQARAAGKPPAAEPTAVTVQDLHAWLCQYFVNTRMGQSLRDLREHFVLYKSKTINFRKSSAVLVGKGGKKKKKLNNDAM